MQWLGGGFFEGLQKKKKNLSSEGGASSKGGANKCSDSNYQSEFDEWSLIERKGQLKNCFKSGIIKARGVAKRKEKYYTEFKTFKRVYRHGHEKIKRLKNSIFHKAWLQEDPGMGGASNP